jgi:hypothetical protein
LIVINEHLSLGPQRMVLSDPPEFCWRTVPRLIPWMKCTARHLHGGSMPVVLNTRVSKLTDSCLHSARDLSRDCSSLPMWHKWVGQCEAVKYPTWPALPRFSVTFSLLQLWPTPQKTH